MFFLERLFSDVIKQNSQNFSVLKNFFNEVYYSYTDNQIKDLSALNADKARLYLKRLKITKPDAYKILKSALYHKNRQVVFETIEILKENRTINSRKILNTLLNSKDQEIVISAIDALRLFKTNDTVKPLIGCLNRKDKNIALAALWTLAEIKTPDAIEAIENVSTSNNEELQRTALWMLKGIKTQKTRSKAASR